MFITGELSKLAIRRQAPKLGELDFEVYVEDLWPFDDKDISAACLKIGRTEREEGETAFPSIQTLVSTLKRIVRERENANPNADIDAYMADVKANPDKYVRLDLAALVEEVAARRVLDPNSPKRTD